MLAPLNDLLKGPRKGRKKSFKIQWGIEQEQAFKEAMSALAHCSNLAYEDPARPLILSTDASTEAAGAVLEQNFGSKEHPIVRPLGFFFKNFSTYHSTPFDVQ